MKVLFLIPHLHLAASNRYRVYQYLPYLNAQGIETTVRPFIDTPEFYQLLYQPGHLILKTALTLHRTLRRMVDLIHIKDYNVIFIQRESLPFGLAWLERIIAVQGKPMVFDFDDAIYLPNISQANRLIGCLKSFSKTQTIIRLCKQVIAGNDYLRDFASLYNKNVSVIPTSIDTEYYTIRKEIDNRKKQVTIGWMGGHTTIEFLHLLDDIFRKLINRCPYSGSLSFRITIVGGDYQVPGVEVLAKPWKLENELSDLHHFDIGVMPMPDNPWTRGKCGLKALQYFGVGIPVVASPIGVNSQIIQHGVNGFLASSEEEWVQSLSMLIENPALRREMGSAGRRTVEEHYSIKVNAPKLIEVLLKANQ